MVGCTEMVKGLAVDFLSDIPLPREAVLVNLRLGIFVRLLQVGAIALAAWVVSFSSFTTYAPTSVEVDLWRGDGMVDVDAVHCTAPSTFGYTYNERRKYMPAGCRKLPLGEDFLKSDRSMFFMTFVRDTITQTRTGSNCSTAQAACAASGRTYEYDNATDSCDCSLREEYFVKNEEKNKLFLRHACQVQASFTGNAYMRGTSSAEYYTERSGTKGVRRRGRMLTRILKEDGSPCKVGGRSEWSPGDGDIGGTLEEWLACGGVALDSQSEEIRSFQTVETMAPHLRTSGARVNLELRYSNTDQAVKRGDAYAVCYITVQVAPAWNSRMISDYTRLGDTSAGGGDSEHRYREVSGVSFEFTSGGSFAQYDPFQMVTGIVSAIVIIGVPLQIVRFIALYGIGVVSTIYSQVLRQRFSIFHQFHGLSARMMVSSIAYRALTNQWDQAVQKLTPMTRQDIEHRMMESFHKDLDSIASHGGTALEAEEVKLLASVVVAGLDKDREGKVSYDEFVHACSSNESMDTKTMIKFFDDERKLWPMERCFDPTRSQILEITKTRHCKSASPPTSPVAGAGPSAFVEIRI